MPEQLTHSQLILDAPRAMQKLRRMAYQIYENNYLEEEIVLAGIQEGGYKIALLLKDVLSKISGIKVILVAITLDKEHPETSDIYQSPSGKNLKGKNVILVDDVGNSGRTLFYAMQPLFLLEPRSLQVALLVERMHKKFPIKADYVGFPIATTFRNHVIVSFDDKGHVMGAYLY